MGQISRDIGVRFTKKTITTHKIDPDTDETREFLLEDLAYSQALEKFAYVGGAIPAPIDEPRGNFHRRPLFHRWLQTGDVGYRAPRSTPTISNMFTGAIPSQL